MSCVGGCGETEQVRNHSTDSYFEYGMFAGNAPCTTKIETDKLIINSWSELFDLIGEALEPNMR